MGFDPNVAILMSGVGTLLFFLVVGGRVPSYLGSSFAFIGAVIAVTGYAGSGLNKNIGVALGGIIACGLLYTLIGLVVHLTREVRHKVYDEGGISVSEVETGASVHWIEKIMPPVVTGAVVAVIGLNLAPIAAKGAMGGTAFEGLMALGTVLVISLIAVFARGMLRRLLILAGLVIAYVVYLLLANGMGLGKPIDFARVAAAPWFGAPTFTAPVFSWNAVLLIAPVALILVAENLGHLRAVAAITGRDMDPYVGRAFMGDGLATMLAGGVGGTGVTTYAENIGVMAVTRIYSTLVFLRRRAVRGVPRLQPEVRRVDPDDSRAGARRRVDRGVRPDHRSGRAHLGAEPRRLRRQPQPHRGGGDADPRRRRLHAEDRRLRTRRDRHGDVRGDPDVLDPRARARRAALAHSLSSRAQRGISSVANDEIPRWARDDDARSEIAAPAFAWRDARASAR